MADPLKAQLTEAISSLVHDLVQERIGSRGFHIYGVEVTQAIQYWDSPTHRDNSIRLVAYKPVYVRVYVRLRGDQPRVGVTGTATLDWPNLRLGALKQTLVPRNIGFVRAEAEPRDERNRPNGCVNFLIPASQVYGRLHLKIQLHIPGTEYSDETDLDLDASLLQTLRLRGIPVRYVPSGESGGELAAPTLANFQQTASLALRLFPVEQTPVITLAGMISTNIILNDYGLQPGVCSESWIDLLAQTKLAKDLDGNLPGSLYYALLPAQMPSVNLQNVGCDSAVAAGRAGDLNTMAHELGHALGFGHAQCWSMATWPLTPPPELAPLPAGQSGFDRQFPVWAPPLPAGSIGHTGVDPTTDTIFPPQNTYDVMSYCGPQWISPYHYSKLIQHPALHPRWIPGPKESLPPHFYDEQYNPVRPKPDPSPSWAGSPVTRLMEPEPEPLVVLTGVWHDEKLEVRSLLRIETRPVDGRQVVGTTVELLDDHGKVIGRSPLHYVPSRASGGCGCGCSEHGQATRALVQAYVRDREGIAGIRVVRGDTELWSRQATRAVPEIRDVVANVDGDLLHVRWHASTSGEHPARYFLRWSADGGAIWQALAADLAEANATIPLAVMMSGMALVQVLVSDGFHTVASEPVPVSVPPRPPTVAILHPTQDGVVATGTLVRLWGIGTASDGRVLGEDAFTWTLDGERASTGSDAWVEMWQREGEHRATLRVRDGDFVSEASVTFVTTCSGHRPARLHDEVAAASPRGTRT